MGNVLGGSGLLVLALFMLLGFLKSDAPIASPATLLAFCITVVLPAIGGTALIYRHFRRQEWLEHRKERLRQRTLEAEILRLAAHRGGKLTVVEVVSELAVEPDTAKQALDALLGQSLAEIELTDSGVLVYTFYDIQHLAEKRASKGVFDA